MKKLFAAILITLPLASNAMDINLKDGKKEPTLQIFKRNNEKIDFLKNGQNLFGSFLLSTQKACEKKIVKQRKEVEETYRKRIGYLKNLKIKAEKFVFPNESSKKEDFHLQLEIDLAQTRLSFFQKARKNLPRLEAEDLIFLNSKELKELGVIRQSYDFSLGKKTTIYAKESGHVYYGGYQKAGFCCLFYLSIIKISNKKLRALHKNLPQLLAEGKIKKEQAETFANNLSTTFKQHYKPAGSFEKYAIANLPYKTSKNRNKICSKKRVSHSPEVLKEHWSLIQAIKEQCLN